MFASLLTAVTGYAFVDAAIAMAVHLVSVDPSIVKVASARLIAHIFGSKPALGLLVHELVIDAAILDAQAMSVRFYDSEPDPGEQHISAACAVKCDPNIWVH